MNRVLVLMSTYNGEKYLEEQLDTILSQLNVVLDLMIRDDGSTDNTLDIIKSYQAIYSNIYLIKGENVGCVQSYMLLLKEAVLINPYDFYAFADQDDYWLNTKLFVGVMKLKCVDVEKPSLYFTQTQLVDDKLVQMSTPKLNLQCSFAESLMVYGVTGCTVIFNHLLLRLLTFTNYSYISMHDTLSYQVCLAMGGEVVFDEQAYILYRQHSNNVLGGINTFRTRWKRRLSQFLSNNRNVRSKSAESIYQSLYCYLPEENKKLLFQVFDYKHNFYKRISIVFNGKFKTTSILNSISFRLSVILGTY